MYGKDFNGTIKTYYQLPKSFGNVIGGFDLLSDSDLATHGFYPIVTPTYDSTIQDLGDIYFDSSNNRFTYPVNNKTWTESLSDLKTKKINKLKRIYNQELAKTDWYVVRKSEDSTQTIPSDVATERSTLRTQCASHESSINAKTTKADVVSYTLPHFT